MRGDHELVMAFAGESMRRGAEARSAWASFAETRQLRYCVDQAGVLPVLEGSVDGTDVRLVAAGDPRRGFCTRATARSKFPLAGTVRVGPPGAWSRLVGRFRRRTFFGAPELDGVLVVKTSSPSVAAAVLDARVVTTVRALSSQRLDELSYVNGLVTIVWAGVERDPHVLDDVIDVLAYLGVRGAETSPYR